MGSDISKSSDRISKVEEPTTNQPNSQTTQTEGSYMGRLVRWLNQTPGGQFTKGMGNILLAGGVAVGALFIVKAAIVTAIVAGVCFASLIGIPLGIPLIGFAGLLLATSFETFKYTSVFWDRAMSNFDNMNKLSGVSA